MTSHARNTHYVHSDTTENAEAIKLFITSLHPHLGERDAIVVAAPSSLKQHLQDAVSAACNRDQAGVNRSLRDVLDLQHQLITETLGEENSVTEATQFLADVQNVVKLLKHIPDQTSARFVLSMAATWTARLIVANLQLANIDSESIDSCNLVRTRLGSYLSNETSARNCLQKALTIVPGVAVLPSLAMDELGNSTDCAANHFATFVSRALNSHSLTMWTNTIEVTSANHADISSDAMESLSHAEVTELSRLSHPLFPCLENITADTDVTIRHIDGECRTAFTITPQPTGVKLVHTVDDIQILHIDCTGSEVSTITSIVEKSLAKVGVQPLATDIDKEGDKVSLAFPSYMIEYVRGALRVNQLRALSLETGLALVAIVGDGLEADWLLSFKFQQTLGASIRMTAKTDVSHIAIVDSIEAANEAVPAIHAELIEESSRNAQSSF